MQGFRAQFICFFLGVALLLGSNSAPGAADPVERAPVPDDAAQRKAREIVRDLYGREYEEAKTATERTALAKKLIGVAADTDEDPAARFVLLEIAKDVAVLAEDAEAALGAIDRLAERFEVDPVAMKVACLEAIGAPGLASSSVTAFAERVLALADEFLEQDRFEAADRLYAVAREAVRKTRNSRLEARVGARIERLDARRAAHAEYETAIARLDEKPTDPAANLTAGRYLCVLRGDWERGLPMLALGGDPTLQELAERDLNRPADGQAQAALGDAWWEYAQESDEAERETWLGRARLWYRRALDRVESDLLKQRIETRLPRPEEEPPRRAARKPAAERIPRGKWVDLLAAVDVERDRVAGEWKRDEAGLSVAASRFARFMLPALVDGSYDLEVEFTRTTGLDTIAFTLPFGLHRCLLGLSCWEGRCAGLSMVDGRFSNNNSSTRRPGTLTNGKRYALLVRVQWAGELAAVAVLLDGEPYLAWKGKRTLLRIHKDWRIPELGRLGVATNECSLTLHAVRLRLVKGVATLLEPGEAGRPQVVSQRYGGGRAPPFKEVAPPGAYLAGFRFRATDRINNLRAIYATPRGLVRGEQHSGGPVNNEVVARRGYAVGGLVVRSGGFVNGLRIIFHRRSGDGRLDADDSYESPFFGEARNQENRIESTGGPVIGVHGTAGRWINSIGLVFGKDEAE